MPMTWLATLVLMQAPVDKAIENGVAFLKKKVLDPAFDAVPKLPNQPANPAIEAPNRQFFELIVWTFIHAGVPEKDPAFQKLLKPIIEKPIWRTYHVALRAMILQKLDPVKYQAHLIQCAQFLVDTQ